MKILLDNGIFSHSEFAEGDTKEIPISWGGRNGSTIISGIKRKSAHKNANLQAEINLLPTVGRLFRESVIEAYDSEEIRCENLRYRPLIPFGNALNGCSIKTCCSPIDRSKFVRTVNITDYFAKG